MTLLKTIFPPVRLMWQTSVKTSYSSFGKLPEKLSVMQLLHAAQLSAAVSSMEAEAAHDHWPLSTPLYIQLTSTLPV